MRGSNGTRHPKVKPDANRERPWAEEVPHVKPMSPATLRRQVNNSPVCVCVCVCVCVLCTYMRGNEILHAAAMWSLAAHAPNWCQQACDGTGS